MFFATIGSENDRWRLSRCLLKAPKNSVIVIEDIDALFGKDRQTLQKTTPLTFSGLLNGLDGVANPDGQIFVLTTNYIDRLDTALIRAGRVDVKIEFPVATPEQIERMFLRFYPTDFTLAKEFVAAIEKRKIGEDGTVQDLCMAALQLHFITCRKKSAEECVKMVEQFIIEKPQPKPVPKVEVNED